MRNLKKVLSLALAMVMLLGMMVIGAGAVDATEYPDYGDVSADKQEAVQVITALSVIDGTEKGMEPQGTLTRAQAATIVARALLGRTVADALASETCVFTDVPDWAKGAVQYCADMGIVYGIGNNLFGSNNPVKGTEFATMLLRAVDPDGDYSGESWASKVIVAANKYGLSANIPVTSTALTREGAAQMAFNTIVDYSPSGATAWSVDGKTFDSFMEAYLYADKLHKVGEISKTAANDSLAKTVFGLESRDSTDAFGRNTKVWKYDDEDVVTVPGTGATKTFTGAITADDLKGYTPADDMVVRVDGVEDASVDTIPEIRGLGGKGVEVNVYTSGTSITKVVAINTYFGQVSRVSTKDDTTTATISRLSKGAPAVSTFESDNFEKGDYVIYTVGSSDGTAGKQAIETMTAADSITGKITATSTSYLRLDGEKYDYTKNANTNDAKTGDAVIYMDGNGNVIYIGEVEASATNYLYVKGADLYFDTISIRAVFADGTTKIVQLDGATRFSGNNVVASGGTLLSSLTPVDGMKTALLNNVYAYTEADDDTVVLTSAALSTEVVNNETAANGNHKDVTITKGKTNLYTSKVYSSSSWSGDTASNVTVNNSTVYVDTTNGTTYTGFRNVPSMTKVTMVYVPNKDNSNLADLVFIASREDGENENATWIYVTDETAKENYGTYTVWTAAYVDGERVDVTTTSSSAFTEAGLYKGTKTNSQGYFTAVAKQATGEVQATVASGNNLTLANNDTYSYDDETLFVFVNGKTVTPSYDTTDIILKNDSMAKGSDITYIYVAEDADNHATAKTVYVIAAKKESGATVNVGATPSKDVLNSAIANAEGSEVELAGITTIPADTVIPVNKTVVIPAGVIVTNITVNGTVKTSSAITGTVTLNNGTIEVADNMAMPTLASGAKGTVKVADEKTANCGSLDEIFTNSKNYAKKTTVTNITGTNGVVTETITANPVTFTGNGKITGFSSNPVGGSDGTKTSALYTIEFPTSVVSGDHTRVAQSITVTYKDGTTRAMDGTNTLDGQVVLLLDTNVSKISYKFAADNYTDTSSGDTVSRAAIEYVFNIG